MNIWRIIVLVSTLCVLVSCDRKVLMTIVVSRHCDRTPFSTFTIPEFKVDLNKILNQTLGKLTVLGEKECYELGTSLRNRYLNPTSPQYIKGINPVFQSVDYELISTSYDRTLRSGMSVSLGLFPNYGGYKLDIPPHDYPLPGGVQAVPYHSTSLDTDKYLLGFDVQRCPNLKINRDNFFASDAGKDVIRIYSAQMNRVLEGTGLNSTNPVPDHANFRDVYYIWDYILALRQHKLLPDWYEDHYFNITRDVTRLSYYYQFKKSIVGKMAGGLFLGQLLEDIDTFLLNVKKNPNSDDGERVRSSRRSRSRSEDEVRGRSRSGTKVGDNWDAGDGTNPKFIHYSAHDQTISVVLSNMGMIDEYTSLRQEVGYGAALIFELWGNDKYEDLALQVLYKDHWAGPFQPYRLPLLGQGGEACPASSTLCEYDLFSRILNQECVITDAEYCSLCGVPSNNDNSLCLKTNYEILKSQYEDLQNQKKNDDGKIGTYKGWLMALSIVSVILFICCICMCVPGCLGCVTSEWRFGKKIRDSQTITENGNNLVSNKNKKRPSSWTGEEEELLSDAGQEDEYLIREPKSPDPNALHSPQHSQIEEDFSEEGGGVGEGGNQRAINYESTDYI